MLDRIQELADFELDNNEVCPHYTLERPVCKACAALKADRKTLCIVARDFVKLAPLLDAWSDEVIQGPTMSKNDDALYELWADIKERMDRVKKPKKAKTGYTGCTCKGGYDNNCIVHGGDKR